MKIAIGSDHAGFRAKEALKASLTTAGHQVEDLGTRSEDSCDYTDFSFAVAESVSKKTAERGVILCGTGIGSAIAANKVHGIRAALVHDGFTAEMSRRHNDANVLVLGARVLAEERIMDLTKTWLETPFDGGRHERRVGKIGEYENRC
ncbi:MAG: ribose 5-phosphate isomerase [Planctomycetota bacterium]|nr:MAG: ribose 5-phosphate isomerase [Planctomycetota bacterium]